MSVELESAARLNALKQGIEAKTGETYTDLTGGVNALIAGFGQGGGGSGGLAYDMGEFVLDKDTHGGDLTPIPHSLGVVPDFVMVWTDEFSDLTVENPSSYSKNIDVGYIWMNGLTGMVQRLTSVNSTNLSVNIALTLYKGDYRVNVQSPSSVVYGMIEQTLPDAEKLYLTSHSNASNSGYIGGITYKYFVAKAWW